MIKTYQGYSLPSPVQIRYSIEWSCERCGSGDVCLDADDTRPLRWCDGLPCMEDQLRFWVCGSCGHKATGRELKQQTSPRVALTDEEGLPL